MLSEEAKEALRYAAAATAESCGVDKLTFSPCRAVDLILTHPMRNHPNAKPSVDSIEANRKEAEQFIGGLLGMM